MSAYLEHLGHSEVGEIPGMDAPLYLSCTIFLSGGRKVGDDTFRLVSFEGQESVSEPFEFQLELHGNTLVRGSRQPTLDFGFSDIIGRPVTVAIKRPDLGAALALDGPAQALFNGIATAFALEVNGVYRLTMKPALARLALTNRYAMHRQRNVRDLIAAILTGHGVRFDMQLLNSHDNLATIRTQDWLQAGESDYDFLRRLMAKAHLFFYFVHTAELHTVVFSNVAVYPAALPAGRALRYTYTGIDTLGRSQGDVISQFSYQETLASSSVQAVHTRQQAAWETDSVAQFHSFHAASAAPGALPFHQHKVFQYGCSDEESRALASHSGEALEASSCVYSGASYCAELRSGHQFTLTGSELFRTSPHLVQPRFEGQAFVLTMVRHKASLDGAYSNEFRATEAHGSIAPFSMQETQQGSILARVVARDGRAAPSDWRFYTAAPPFDPERETISDRLSTPADLSAMGVFVKFATDGDEQDPVWVKLSASMETVPEIGATVVIARAQDESELPEVQNIIKSNGNTCIMPSAWTASTRVGSNYSTSYGDGKSIRFGLASEADLARAVGLVGQTYDSGKYKDTSYNQGASYSFSAADGAAAAAASDQGELFGDLGGVPDLLSASESFGSNFSRQQATVSSNVSKLGTSYNHSTTGTSRSVSRTGSHRGESVTGSSESSDTTGSTSSRQLVGSSEHVSATGISRSTTATGSSTGISLTGMSNSAAMTGVSNSVSATGVSNSAQSVGVSNSASLTGASNSISATGISEHIATTGISTSATVTGVSASSATTGVSTSMAVTGLSSAVSVSGISTSTSIAGLSRTVALNGAGSDSKVEPGRMTIEIKANCVSIPVIMIFI